MSQASSVAVLKLRQIEAKEASLRNEVIKDAPKYLELKHGIQKFGLLSAISVAPMLNEDGTCAFNTHGEQMYTLIDGLHRLTAHEELSLETIQCVVTSVEESNRIAAQIMANSSAIPTTRAQYANGLKRILQLDPITVGQLAEKIGQSKAWVESQLTLTKLSASVQKAIDDGSIPAVNAVALARLPAQYVEDYVARAVTEPTSVFSASIDEALKAIRAAQKTGKPMVIEFKPQASLRKPTELKVVLESGVDAIIQGTTTPEEAAYAVLKWVLQLDPASVVTQKAKFDQHEREKAEAKTKREAEKAEKQKALAATIAATALPSA